MIESCYGLTDCPTCGKMVAVVLSPDWEGAQYLCVSCGSAFEFKIEDVDG